MKKIIALALALSMALSMVAFAGYTDAAEIKANLIAQLTAPVRWTQIVKNMIADGVECFTELGPGNVLQGLIKKCDANATVESKASM